MPKREYPQYLTPQTLILPLKIGVNEFYGALLTRNTMAYKAAQMALTRMQISAEAFTRLYVNAHISVGTGKLDLRTLW